MTRRIRQLAQWQAMHVGLAPLWAYADAHMLGMFYVMDQGDFDR